MEQRYKIRDFEFVKSMSDIEERALSMLKPIPLDTLDPMVIIPSTPEQRDLWHYWRVAISSAPQGGTYNMGRSTPYIVLDRTTKGLLGVFAITDSPIHDPFLDDLLDWEEANYNLDRPGSIQNANKAKWLSSLVLLRRCLPLYEFGQITGGKLITMAALSNEVIRGLELRYSFKLSMMFCKSLHGRAVQYTRMENVGLKYYGTDDDNMGFYGCELRKGALRTLRGEKANLGKLQLKPYADTVELWKQRWGLPRAQKMGIDTLTFDKDQYRLTNLFSHPGKEYGPDL